MQPTTSHPRIYAWSGEILIPSAEVQLEGTLTIPTDACGLVLFAHGSGSSRHSTRNRAVAGALQNAGMATLLFDLLTSHEERIDAVTGHLRFDVKFLATRLRAATRWVHKDERTASLPVGYFGASTGAAAALIAAADPAMSIGAVVSRGGRPDLAGDALPEVHAPTLLIVGGADESVIPLNEEALDRIHAVKHLEIIQGATHLFQEPGSLEQVAELAADWFARYLHPQE